MQQLADVTRALDFDSGFAMGALELISGSGVSISEGDVVRAFNEFHTELRELHARFDSLPHLPDVNRRDLLDQLSYWSIMEKVLTDELDACNPGTRYPGHHQHTARP